MKTLSVLSVLTMMLLALSGCQPISAQPESVPAEDQVRAASAEWDGAFNSADLDRLGALYAEDAVDMPPGFPALEGKEAVLGDLAYILDEFEARHETSIVDIVISGDLAIERANYTMELKPKAGGDTINEVGKHIVIRQKNGDEWMILWEIWNSDS